MMAEADFKALRSFAPELPALQNGLIQMVRLLTKFTRPELIDAKTWVRFEQLLPPGFDSTRAKLSDLQCKLERQNRDEWMAAVTQALRFDISKRALNGSAQDVGRSAYTATDGGGGLALLARGACIVCGVAGHGLRDCATPHADLPAERQNYKWMQLLDKDDLPAAARLLVAQTRANERAKGGAVDGTARGGRGGRGRGGSGRGGRTSDGGPQAAAAAAATVTQQPDSSDNTSSSACYCLKAEFFAFGLAAAARGQRRALLYDSGCTHVLTPREADLVDCRPFADGEPVPSFGTAAGTPVLPAKRGTMLVEVWTTQSHQAYTLRLPAFFVPSVPFALLGRAPLLAAGIQLCAGDGRPDRFRVGQAGPELRLFDRGGLLWFHERVPRADRAHALTARQPWHLGSTSAAVPRPAALPRGAPVRHDLDDVAGAHRRLALARRVVSANLEHRRAVRDAQHAPGAAAVNAVPPAWGPPRAPRRGSAPPVCARAPAGQRGRYEALAGTAEADGATDDDGDDTSVAGESEAVQPSDDEDGGMPGADARDVRPPRPRQRRHDGQVRWDAALRESRQKTKAERALITSGKVARRHADGAAALAGRRRARLPGRPAGARPAAIPADLAHRICGHYSVDATLVERHVANFRVTGSRSPLPCAACVRGKAQLRAVRRGQHRPRARAPRSVYHCDMTGRKVLSADSYEYSLLLTDDYTRLCRAYFLQTRQGEEVAQALRDFHSHVLLEGPAAETVTIYCDSEFAVGAAARQMDAYGWVRRVSVPHTHAGQGTAERVIKTVVSNAEAMLKETELGPTYWTWAVRRSVYLFNRLPTSTSPFSAYELAFGAQPDFSDEHVFGATVLGTLTDGKRRKAHLDDRAWPGIWLGMATGYAHGTAYVLRLDTGNILPSANYVVYEDHFVAPDARPAVVLHSLHALHRRPLSPMEGESATGEFRRGAGEGREAGMLRGNGGADGPLLGGDGGAAGPPPGGDGGADGPGLDSDESADEDSLAGGDGGAADGAGPDSGFETDSEFDAGPDSDDDPEIAAGAEDGGAQGPVRPKRGPKPRAFLEPSIPRPGASRVERQTYGERIERREDAADDAAHGTDEEHEEPEGYTAMLAAECQRRRAWAAGDVALLARVEQDARSGLRLWTTRQRGQYEADLEDIENALMYLTLHAGAEALLEQGKRRKVYDPQPTTNPVEVPLFEYQLRRMARRDRLLWIDSMKAEWEGMFTITQSFEPEPWKIVDAKKVGPVLDFLWIFDRKASAELKSRFTIRGDQDQTYVPGAWTSPTVTMPLVKLMLAVGMTRGYTVQTWDVPQAFLRATLDRDIFVKAPALAGLAADECLKLRASVYGLGDAAQLFYLFMAEALTKFGMRVSRFHPCIFVGQDSSGRQFYLGIYVDDLTLVGEEESLMQLRVFLAENNVPVEVQTGRGTLLGMDWVHDAVEHTVTLDYARYEKAVLEELEEFELPLCNTPMQEHLPMPDEDSDGCHPLYRSIVGKLLWICNVRNEIRYGVKELARHMVKNGPVHWQALLRVCGYLKANPGQRLTIRGCGNGGVLQAYSDASFADEVQTGCSTSGMVFLLGNTAFDVRSKTQKVKAVSSGESEVYAMSDCARELVFYRRILEEMDMEQKQPTTIWCDATTAIAMAKERLKTSRARHIDVRKLVVRDYIDEGVVQIKKCGTKDMLADVMTKPMKAVDFGRFAPSLRDSIALTPFEGTKRKRKGPAGSEQAMAVLEGCQGEPRVLYGQCRASVMFDMGQGLGIGF